MFGILGAIFMALGCQQECSTACEMFNGLNSCYVACGCMGPTVFYKVPAEMMIDAHESMRRWAGEVRCEYEKFDECQRIENLDEYLKCVESCGCEKLNDFKELVGNIPKDLWLGVRPKVLVNYLGQLI